MSDSPAAPARFKDLCLDARDHQALADWWCAAMGYEPETVENRMHHDVVGDTAALLAMGAALVRARDDVGQSDHDAGLISWDVLADPEGNEFCCFAPED
jgi:hypothetical protein